ncbi:DExH-box splicing factor binding site-domain-containing protein [Syncephalis fuscata]|nr:DExH-box splicing factor binding site-domain-containing protein [Syncephalis fuscata]
MYGGKRIRPGTTAKISFTLSKSGGSSSNEDKLTATTSADNQNDHNDHNKHDNNNTANINSSNSSSGSSNSNTLNSLETTTKKIGFNLNLNKNRKPILASSSVFAAASKSNSASNRKRRRRTDEDDEDDEDASIHEKKDQVIALTGFEGNEAQRLHPVEEPEGPLVIKAVKNKDWREEMKRRLLGSTLSGSKAAATASTLSPVQGAVERVVQNTAFGLQLTQKKKLINEDQGEIVSNEVVSVVSESLDKEVSKVELSIEEQAIKALYSDAQKMNNSEDEDEDENSSKSKLVIAMSDANMNNINAEDRHRLEVDAFRDEYANCPDSSTLEDYEDVPVEEFGAALLRGMGWKEGQGIGRGHRDRNPTTIGTEQRPRLLGLGAKPLPVDLQETSNRPKKPRLPLPRIQ